MKALLKLSTLPENGIEASVDDSNTGAGTSTLVDLARTGTPLS